MAFAVVFISACMGNDEKTVDFESVLPDDKVVRLEVGVGNLQSKAGATTENLAEMGMFITGAGDYTCVNARWTKSGNTWSTDVPVLWKSADSTVDIMLYAPYRDTTWSRNLSGDYHYNCLFLLPTDQSTEAGLLAADVLRAIGTVMPTRGTTEDPALGEVVYNTNRKALVAQMQHVMSKIVVTLRLPRNASSGEENPVSSMQINGTDTHCELNAGEIKNKNRYINYVLPIDMRMVDYTPATAMERGIIVYEAIIVPQKIPTVWPFMICFTLNGLRYEWISETDMNFESGKQYHLTLDLLENDVQLTNVQLFAWETGMEVMDDADEYIPFRDPYFVVALKEKGIPVSPEGKIDVTDPTTLNALDTITQIAINGTYSLDGIEYLTGLKQLSIDATAIKQLNLSHLTQLERLHIYRAFNLTILDLSNCTQLKRLTIQHMSDFHDIRMSPEVIANIEYMSLLNFTNLTHLDLSYFTGLTSLICNGNEQLTSLNVSTLTNLKTLDCSSNSLTSLDASNLTSLTFLNCYKNQLGVLDVSNLTNLEVLRCGMNQLTTLDVSNNKNLIQFNCYVNQLTSLNVSNLTNLIYLYCNDNQINSLDVSKNTALSQLDCGDNLLTELNVSNLTNLINLYCDNNTLTSLDVSNLTCLTSLSCYANQLTSLNLSNNKIIRNLNCRYNHIASLDVSMLGAGFFYVNKQTTDGSTEQIITVTVNATQKALNSIQESDDVIINVKQ